MTKEEIIKTARNAGMVFHLGMPHEAVLEQLTRFAEIIIANEREACAAVCIDLVNDTAMAGKCLDSEHDYVAAAHDCSEAIRRRMTLLYDIARCRGVQIDGDWREGCSDCLRRTAPGNPERQSYIVPPVIVVFECEYRLEPDTVQNNA